MNPITRASAHLAKNCLRSRKQIQRLLRKKLAPMVVEPWTIPPLLA